MKVRQQTRRWQERRNGNLRLRKMRWATIQRSQSRKKSRAILFFQMAIRTMQRKALQKRKKADRRGLLSKPTEWLVCSHKQHRIPPKSPWRRVRKPLRTSSTREIKYQRMKPDDGVGISNERLKAYGVNPN